MVEKTQILTLCEKVQVEIKNLIKKNPNQKLPSERNLAEQMSVSRITVRNAYQALVSEGMLVPGKRGYPVKKTGYEQVLTLDGFTRGIGEKEKVSTQVLSVETILPEREIMVALGCDVNDEIIRIKRLRLIGQKPYQVEYCHLIKRVFPEISEQTDLRSLYQIFEKSYGIRIVRAEQILAIINPSTDIQQLLDLKNVEKVLFLKRTSFNQKNAAIEYVHLFLNPEGREFYMELKR